MFFIASSGSLQTETHPGLSPRGTFKSLPLQLVLTAAAFGGTWNTQGNHWFKGTMFASRDPCTTFSGVHGPGLTCSEFLQFMGVCVCQTHNQLSLYIYPKLVYSRINQILMSYAPSRPCNSMHNFLLCSNTSQLSVGALSLFSATAADGNHSWCSVKCKSISFCFVLFSPLSLLLLHALAFLTPTGNNYASVSSLWCSLQACSTAQDRDLGEGILGEQRSDINQNSYRERSIENRHIEGIQLLSKVMHPMWLLVKLFQSYQ